MVFSFFKKDKQPETQPKPKAATPAASKAAVPPPSGAEEIGGHEEDAYSVIEVSYADQESSAETHSIVEEVAILYSNNRVGEATQALVHYLKESTDTADLQPWLLLFELYQLQGLRHQFDELSLEFVVKMERSAPLWEENRVATSKKPKVATAPQVGSSVVAVKGTLTGTCDAERNKLLEQAATPAGVRLDLSEVEGADTTGSGRMAGTLNQIRKSGGRLSVIGSDVLIAALTKAIGVRKDQESKNYWRLLCELYQYLGLQEEFEELAIQYAVTFEESPLSWEEVPLQATDVGAGAEQAASRGDVYVLEGAIDMASEPEFKLIKDFAESRPNITIDMSQVPRVDFATVGLFISMLIGLSQAGKTVVITGANQLVQALFEIMGVKEFATIKRH